MGMQCTFNIRDLSDGASVKFSMNMPADEQGPAAYLAVIATRSTTGCDIESFDTNWQPEMDNQENPHVFCWFDCGHLTDASMELIKWLIRNRIPFTCA